MDEFSNGYDIHGKERLTMVGWILSWLMPALVASKGLKRPSEAKIEAHLRVGSYNGK